jgi:alpha-glucosidase (family GH31 glycosyl hydrolase)
MQRYAAGVNQGDFWSSWELMRIETVWLLNMGMSGVFFPETDIGGHYATEELTDELFIRWAFLGTFGPLMRSHGHNWRCRLPWGFGPENEFRFTRLIRLRSVLFPYNYTLLSQANQTGLPMMRAMILAFPEDRETRTIWDQYLWGPDILVAPVYQKGVRERKVYLPKGLWVHYWTLQPFEGPARITVDAPLGQDPVFLRAGGVIPMREPSDTIPTESDSRLLLLVLPAAQAGSFTVYDDDRQTYRYEQGESSRQTFVVSAKEASGSFSLDIGPVEGEHAGIKREREYRVEIPHLLASIHTVRVGGVAIPQRFPTEELASKTYWQALPDRLVVELDRRAGPLRLDFT